VVAANSLTYGHAV